MKAKTDVRKRIESARKSFQAGDYTRALQDIDEVLRLDESNTEAMSLRDQIAAAGQREAVAMAAEAVRNAASEADPDRRVAILHAAALRNPEDQHLQMLLVLNESRRDVLASLAARARFFDRKRRFDDALEQLRHLETLHPEFPGLAELRATVQRHKEHPEEVVDTPAPQAPLPVISAPVAPPPADLGPKQAAPPPPAPPKQEKKAPPPVPAPQVEKAKPPAQAAAPQPNRRMLWAGLAGAVVLIAAVAGYFLKSGGGAAPSSKFELALQPADARLEIDGKPQDVATLSLNPGEYKFKITRPGYKSVEQQIKYSGGQLRFNLEPLNPLIRIDANLPGGEYSVDGQPAKPLEEGQANLGDLPPGHHTLKVNTPKHGESTIEVETFVAKPPQVGTSVPAKDVASYAISSFDNGASLYTSLPNLPVKLEAGDPLGKTGDQPLAIAGKNGAEQRLVIGEGDQQLLVTAMFDSRPEFVWFLRGSAPPAGGISVRVDQDDVMVRIDGKLQGAKLKNGEVRAFRGLDPGKHDVKVEKPGYRVEPSSQSVTVVKGRDEKVEFKLVAVSSIEIRGSKPGGARVFVNGVDVGAVGADGNGRIPVVDAGPCKIELKREKFTHKTVEKTCKAGEPLVLTGDEVKMVAVYGWVEWVSVTPASAKITAQREGEAERAISAGKTELPTGRYTFRATAPGFLPQSAPGVSIVPERVTDMGTWSLKPEK